MWIFNAVKLQCQTECVFLNVGPSAGLKRELRLGKVGASSHAHTCCVSVPGLQPSRNAFIGLLHHIRRDKAFLIQRSLQTLQPSFPEFKGCIRWSFVVLVYSRMCCDLAVSPEEMVGTIHDAARHLLRARPSHLCSVPASLACKGSQPLQTVWAVSPKRCSPWIETEIIYNVLQQRFTLLRKVYFKICGLFDRNF